MFLALFFTGLISCSGNSTSTFNSGVKNPDFHSVQQTGQAISLNNKDWQAKLNENTGAIIDIRTPDEWKEGYIKDTQFANIFDKDFIEQINTIEANKNNPIYIYCRSGNRSKQAMTVLLDNGYTQIFELNTGIMGWVEDGYKTVK